MPSVIGTDWSSRGWGGFRWSPWKSVEEVTSVKGYRETVPEREGVYRIRMYPRRRLAYIGQAGNLANRIMGVWSRANDIGSSSASTEAALQHLWRWLECLDGNTYEISWTLSCPAWSNGLHDKTERKACERYFMWLYRQETGHSSFANHSRATKKGSDIIDSETDPGTWRPRPFRPSSRPLQDRGRPPHSMSWMTAGWTPVTCHEELTPGGAWDPHGREFQYESLNPGIYKILDPSLREVLKVGYGKKIRLGVLDSVREVPGQPVIAWSALPYEKFRFHCQEQTDDLVGACYARYGRALRYGFPD
jgi:hypothetical protein